MHATAPASPRTVPGHLGEVLRPGSTGWDAARQAWNLTVDQHPELVLRPTRPEDVVAAVRFAREQDLRIAVQGTGHGAAPLGDLAGTILIRTGALDEVAVDATRRRARTGAGVIWAHVTPQASALGLTALHGSAPDVGVAGYSLGGGVGWLARRYGLASSAVTAVELVTADGHLVRADARHEPELFWGLRGGGGNFGIVTALEFGLFPVERVFAGWLVWPLEHAVAVLHRWVEMTADLPEAMTSVARVLRLPSAPFVPEPFRGRDLVVVEGAYLGDAERGRQLLRPLTELRPEMDTFAMIPAAGLADLHRDPEGPTPGIGNGGLIDRLPPDAVDAVLATVGPASDSPLLSFEIRHLGGALAVPAPGAGALSHFDEQFMYYGVGIPFGPGADMRIAERLTALATVTCPWIRGRTYLNFDESSPDARRGFDAATYDRLMRLRDRIDPERRFRANHEIGPRSRERA